MRNFKKRIVSFVSAIALAATILPGAELIASAADTVLSFSTSNGDFNYESTPNNSSKYSGWINNCEPNKYIRSKNTVSFDAGKTYEITLEAAVERDDNDNYVYHMPSIKIGNTTVGTFFDVGISNKDNPTSTYDNGEWANSYDSSAQCFKYTKTLYYTPSASSSETVEVVINETQKKDRIHFGTLTIAESEYTVVAESSTFGNYNDSTSVANFNLDGYTEAKVVLESCSGRGDVRVYAKASGGSKTQIGNYSNPVGDKEITINPADYSVSSDLYVWCATGTKSCGSGTVPTQPLSVKVLATGGSAPESSSQGESSYTITTVASPTAGGNVTGSGSYASGSSATLTATANPGYTFTKWQKDGVDISGATNATYTIASVAAADAGTYTAVFTAESSNNSVMIWEGNKEVTWGSYPEAGVPADFSVVEGGTITIEYTTSGSPEFKFIAKDSGWGDSDAILTKFSGAPSGAGTQTFSFVLTAAQAAKYNNERTGFAVQGVNAILTKYYYTPPAGSETTYTISTAASPAEGGTVTGGGEKAEGSSVTLTATANSGYTFTKWQKNGVDIADATNATYTIASVAAADAGTYTAVFTQDTPANNYTISTAASPAEGGTVTGGGEKAEGSSVTLIATANSGYTFTKWQKDGVDIAGATSATYNIASVAASDEATYTAVFTQSVTPSVTYPQTVNAIENSAINSAFVSNVNINDKYFADNDKDVINVKTGGNGLDSGTHGALPFIIDDTSSSVTYTISVYLMGKSGTVARIFGKDHATRLSAATDIARDTKDWDNFKDNPAVFTLHGDDFTEGTGTYYAGFYAGNSDDYINLQKVVVEKSGGQSDVTCEVVGPYRSGTVSASGTTLTATPRSEYQFVGWYGNADCTGDALSTSSTYTATAGDTVYAKFDYVKYNLPIIDIKTSASNGSYSEAWLGGKTKKTKYNGSAITLANSSYNLTESTVQIKGRGNSTWALDKKPYELNFDNAVNLFNQGTAANKTWILLANHGDRTLMRNQLAYTWARNYLDGIPFTTGATPVEVYMNGDYIGMYIVVEKSRVADGRVDIDVTSETTNDMSQIGFLAEWDKLAEKNGEPQEDYYIKTNVAGFSEFFTLHSGVYSDAEKVDGKPTDATTSGGNNTNTTAMAIGDYLNAVSAAIMSGNEATIRSYVNMDSFVDMFILQEFTKNPDCGGSSFYMYKDKGVNAKLTLGPAWDFDKAMGDEIRVTRATGLYINGGDPESNNNTDNVNTWFQSLYGQQWFRDLVIARWHDLRSNPTTNPDNLKDQLDAFYTANANSIDRQRTKWSYDMTHEFDSATFWGDYGLSGSYFNNATTATAQKTGLRNWITDRIAFLDTEWSGNAVTINAQDYDSPEFKYPDSGDQPAIPFVVTNSNGDVTEHDIIVTMNYTGSGKWVNVFTPELPSGTELQYGFDSNNTTTQDAIASAFSEMTDGLTIQKHAIQQNGPFTFVIPAGSPTGTYFAGVSGADSFDSITVRYVDDDGIQEFGTASEYTFTYAAGANGTVTATYDVNGTPTEVVSGSTLPRGTVVTLTATPDEGYEFRGWAESGSIVSTVSPRTITVNRNVDTTAEFVEEGAVYSLTLTANDHIDSATGDMTKVGNTYKVPQGGSYGNLVSVPFYLSEAATVTIDVSAWLSGNGDGWTKFELFDINGVYLDPAVELVLEAGNSARDSSQEKIYTFSANLPAGAYRFGMYGKEWDSFRQVTLSTEEPNLLSLEAPVGAALDPAPIFKVNKDAYGYTSKAKAGDTYYVDEKVTAVAREGYMFVNWSIVTTDGEHNESIVPIDQAEGFTGVNARNKVLPLTAAMAGRTIYANFGEKQSIRYEAESFVNLVSEGYVIPKKTLQDQEVPEEEWVKHKMSNAEFYGRTWDNHPTPHPYDAPKVVTDGESEVKQIWDDTYYTDHKIVTSGYSGGKAVALTGPTSGVAIPFTVNEELLDDFTFALGYNYGDMPTNYTNDGGSHWYDNDVFVNVYATATLTTAQQNALKAKGWGLSEYADTDHASDTILEDAKVGTEGGRLQTAFYKPLPINSLNWKTNNSDDPRENVQEFEVTLPAGLPVGKYYVSVATDHSNLFGDDAAGRKDESFGADSEGNYTGTGTVGTAYYDYIEFFTASTPDMPSPITVGANFIFRDMFGNNLMSNEFSQATFSENTGIVFRPVVPRYLQVQGYKIDYWMYTVDGVTTYVLPDGSTSGTAPTLSDLDSFDTYQEFNILAEVIEDLAFPQGSTITFTAHYAVKNDVYELTVDKGRVYVMEDEDDDSPELLPRGNVYKISNYGMVKLVANADSDRDGHFQYWTLNGQIYSYDREVIFTAWCDANFVAVFAAEELEEVTPAAFISDDVQTFGFDTTDKRYHKISFDCAFYIPDKNDFLSCGIIYSPYADSISDEAFATSGLSVTDYGTFENMPNYTAAASAEYDQLFAKANHQVIISITGVANNKYRSARAYYIYNDNGTPRVVFSSTIATVHTPEATS